MSKFSEVERFVRELSARETVLNVLINNAGTTWAEPIDEYPVRQSLSASLCLTKYHTTKDEGFSKVLTLNLQRVFTLMQKLLPLLRAGAAQGGKTGAVYNDPTRIINVSPS
jgi:NAD(P)-dependent dehydrogenase (short-subunit alcohol dehydrogenase family)